MKKIKCDYFECSNCGFVQTQKPTWLQKAYQEPINKSDTGIVNRNLELSRITTNLIYYLLNSNGVYLDYAGGYGLFTRLMRDLGFDFLWHDKYCENLFARGFDFEKKEHREIELVTCFEVFEHLLDPVKEINKIIKVSSNVFFTTELVNKNTLNASWWYLGLEHGQHVSFYSLRSLKLLAEVLRLNFYSNGQNIHLFSKDKCNYRKFLFLLRDLGNVCFKFAKRKLDSKIWEDHLSQIN